jgi:hypothetical protein
MDTRANAKRTWRLRRLTQCLALLVTWSPGHLVSWSFSAADSEPEYAFAERALRKAGASTDGPGLLAFIRARTLNETQRKELAKKVRALGSAEFEEREKVGRELVAVGRLALPYLRSAVNDPDLEIARRARGCIERIQRDPNPSLLSVAARLVKARRPHGATAVLLSTLPSVGDDSLEQTWLDALRALGWSEGRPEPQLVAALQDKRAICRAAAAHVLGRGPDAEVRRRVAALLNDADARVRFEAAAALARFGNKKAVAVLIALLEKEPFTLACQAEYLLRLLAEGRGPAASLDKDEAGLRQECRSAWETWWSKESGRVDLARLQREQPPSGLTVACEDDKDSGRVWAWGQSGQPCWEVPRLEGPKDVQLLSNGRVLIAEHHANRVSERNREGKLLWEYETSINPIACQRLANGNTLIATYEEVYEVTREGEKRFRHRERQGIRDARRLANGHLLYVAATGVLLEFDATGEHELRRIRPEDYAAGARVGARVEPLLNGRYLLALAGADRVIEIDSAGKIHWDCKIARPMAATRLRNGHTLIASLGDHCVLEVDRTGKEVNKLILRGRPVMVRPE